MIFEHNRKMANISYRLNLIYTSCSNSLLRCQCGVSPVLNKKGRLTSVYTYIHFLRRLNFILPRVNIKHLMLVKWQITKSRFVISDFFINIDEILAILYNDKQLMFDDLEQTVKNILNIVLFISICFKILSAYNTLGDTFFNESSTKSVQWNAHKMFEILIIYHHLFQIFIFMVIPTPTSVFDNRP